MISPTQSDIDACSDRKAVSHKGQRTGQSITALLRPSEGTPKINFALINTAALAALPSLLARWLPDGRRVGREWVARNPRRTDRTSGSFKINITSGRWSDFATGDAGGDIISLAAYLHGLSQGEAARRLAQMLSTYVRPL